MQTSCTGIELCTYTVRRRTVTGSPPRINVYCQTYVRYTPRPQRHVRRGSIGAWESKNLWPPRKRHGGCSFSVFTRQGGSPVVDMKEGCPGARSRRGLCGAGTAAAWLVLDRSGHELRLRAAGWGRGGHGLTCGKGPRATSQAHVCIGPRPVDMTSSHPMHSTSPLARATQRRRRCLCGSLPWHTGYSCRRRPDARRAAVMAFAG